MTSSTPKTAVTAVVVAGLVLVLVVIFLKWKRRDMQQRKRQAKVQRTATEVDARKKAKDDNDPIPETMLAPTQSEDVSCDVEQQPTSTESDEECKQPGNVLLTLDTQGEHQPRDNGHTQEINANDEGVGGIILEEETREVSCDGDEARLASNNDTAGDCPETTSLSHHDQLDDLAFGLDCMYDGVDYSDDDLPLSSSQNLRRSNNIKENHRTNDSVDGHVTNELRDECAPSDMILLTLEEVEVEEEMEEDEAYTQE